ncbi:MAG: hypothetical protein EXR65_01210 [Dehalococcoidia bacterium]|nr:hypothetical protein [Dehalococcoidia bacterium]
MRPLTLRQQLLSTFSFTVLFSVVYYLFFTDRDWVQAALTAPMFYAVMFFSMRASSLLLRVVASRLRPPPPASERPSPPAPSTERPDHALRRRSRRRRRGRRG